jgi:hypothetical protein
MRNSCVLQLLLFATNPQVFRPDLVCHGAKPTRSEHKVGANVSAASRSTYAGNRTIDEIC